MFSSSLSRFKLKEGVWEGVQPSGGKPPATAGHSMVFHALSRTLLVYGGHRPTSARYNNTQGDRASQSDVQKEKDEIII